MKPVQLFSWGPGAPITTSRNMATFLGLVTGYRPFGAKPSPYLLFIKLWAATLIMPEMEKACQQLLTSLLISHASIPVDFYQVLRKGVSKINEQLLKWRDVQRNSPRKNRKKNTLGGLHRAPPPLPCTSEG